MTETKVPGVPAGVAPPLVTETSVDQVRRIVALPPGPERDLAIDTFMREHDRLHRNQARNLCRINSVPEGKYLEDVYAIVLAGTWMLLVKCMQEPDLLPKVETWEAIQYRFVRDQVRRELDRIDAPASGMVNKRRRYREVERTRSALRVELRREPTPEEIVEATNARLLATRKDAARQAILVTEEDLSLQVTVPPEAADGAHTDLDDSFVLHPAEGKQLVGRVLRVVEEADPTLHRVAQLWFGEVYVEGGAAPGRDLTSYIANNTGLTPREVRESVAQIRRLALGMLRDMGIDGPGGAAA